jgi:hypothetical protein
MRDSVWLRMLGALAIAGALALSGGTATAAGAPTHYTCTGGDIPSGTYASITVTGVCQVPADGSGVITVVGNLNVASGGVFDAQSSPSTITVGHNVTAAPGSLVGLGCQPASLVGNSAHPCATEPDGHSTITVNGNLTGTGTVVFLLNGITVKGNVTLAGGGSDEIPWSIKNNTIGRNLTVSAITDEWLGVMFNHVGGNATLTNITLHDVDPGAPGVYIVENVVGRNLNCSRLIPGVSPGFIPGEHNTVGHRANGQCAALV